MLIGLIILSCIAIHQAHSCDSKDSVHPENVELGQSITLICPLKTCQESRYKFYHITKNQTTVQTRLVHHGKFRYILNVRSLDNAGEYYCIEQCKEEDTDQEDKKCWFNMTIPPKIVWGRPKTVHQYEDARGSCTFIGNPVPLSNLLYIEECMYSYNMTVIDPYTVRVNFTIHNAIKACKIHCFSTTHSETKRLHIIAAINVNNTAHSSSNESTLMPTPTPTRTIQSSTHKLTHVTSPSSIFPTIDIKGVSSEHQVATGIDNTNNNNNNNNNNNKLNIIIGMNIALILLVIILVILFILYLTFNTTCTRQDSKTTNN